MEVEAEVLGSLMLSTASSGVYFQQQHCDVTENDSGSGSVAPHIDMHQEKRKKIQTSTRKKNNRTHHSNKQIKYTPHAPGYPPRLCPGGCLMVHKSTLSYVKVAQADIRTHMFAGPLALGVLDHSIWV